MSKRVLKHELYEENVKLKIAMHKMEYVYSSLNKRLKFMINVNRILGIILIVLSLCHIAKLTGVIK